MLLNIEYDIKGRKTTPEITIHEFAELKSDWDYLTQESMASFKGLLEQIERIKEMPVSEKLKPMIEPIILVSLLSLSKTLVPDKVMAEYASNNKLDWSDRGVRKIIYLLFLIAKSADRGDANPKLLEKILLLFRTKLNLSFDISYEKKELMKKYH